MKPDQLSLLHPPNRYRGPPMTLGNMRANGVCSLSVSCLLCNHRAVLGVDRWSDDVAVPSFGPRMVCTNCGPSAPTPGRTGRSGRRDRP